MAPLSFQTWQQISQRHRLAGRIDGRTSKSSVTVE
jgi:hypothetical protein